MQVCAHVPLYHTCMHAGGGPGTASVSLVAVGISIAQLFDLHIMTVRLYDVVPALLLEQVYFSMLLSSSATDSQCHVCKPLSGCSACQSKQGLSWVISIMLVPAKVKSADVSFSQCLVSFQLVCTPVLCVQGKQQQHPLRH